MPTQTALSLLLPADIEQLWFGLVMALYADHQHASSSNLFCKNIFTLKRVGVYIAVQAVFDWFLDTTLRL